MAVHVRLLLTFGALCGCTPSPSVQPPATRIIVRTTDSLPPAPRVNAYPAAASLIGVVIAVDSIAVHQWFVANVKAVAQSDSVESAAELGQPRLSDTAWLPVQPYVRYVVTARLVSTTTPARASPWTAGISVTTPRAPTRAPRTPGSLVAVAESPYAIRLTWSDQSDDEYGFAIERASADGLTFERVRLQQPNTTSWAYSGLAPGEAAMFRVVSFNSAGVSAPSAQAAATTHTDVARATSTERGENKTDTLAACLATAVDLSRADAATEGDSPRLYWAIPFGSHRVDMRTYLCGNANCNVSLYAEYRGCKREIGDLFFVPGDSASPGWTIRAIDSEGWPVIATISHLSYASFSVATYQLIRGQYRGVNWYQHCGAMRDVAWTGRSGQSSVEDADPRTVALRQLRPPFNNCQLDDPVRR